MSQEDRHRAMEMVERLCSTPVLSCLIVEGEPSSKCRARFFRGHAFTPAATRAAEKYLSLRLANMPKFSGNVVVGAIFYRSNRQRIDVDNLLKLVLDAATKAQLWEDDSQVTALVGVVEHDAERPRTIIAFGEHATSMARGDNRKIPCGACGKLFVPYTGGRKHCSAECRVKLSAPVACSQCGEMFHRRSGNHRLCSNACRMAALQAIHQTRGPLPTCNVCGKQLSRHGYKRCRGCFLADEPAELFAGGETHATR